MPAFHVQGSRFRSPATTKQSVYGLQACIHLLKLKHRPKICVFHNKCICVVKFAWKGKKIIYAKVVNDLHAELLVTVYWYLWLNWCTLKKWQLGNGW